jgi:hypothetical protein
MLVPDLDRKSLHNISEIHIIHTMKMFDMVSGHNKQEAAQSR